MPSLPSSLPLWVVLIAPGFLTIIIAVSLGAIEQEISDWVLLISSLLMSVFIDTTFLSLYQILGDKTIRSLNSVEGLFFDPWFRADLIFYIFIISTIFGIVLTMAIIYEFDKKVRELLWFNQDVKHHPHQPWSSFFRQSRGVRVKTSDDQLFSGLVNEWSRANKEKELVLTEPHRFSTESEDYERVGGEKILFLQNDIDRVLMQEEHEDRTLIERVVIKLSSTFKFGNHSKLDEEDVREIAREVVEDELDNRD